MSVMFRPARRENTPLIIGIAGPTKSGKTYSAHRLAEGLANGGPIAMINAEGARGRQYADYFKFSAFDLTAPYRPARYTEALQAALALEPRPAVVIIDSLSHMHNGPGGMLEYHEEELDRLAGKNADYKKRQAYTWSARIKPRAEENHFVYALLAADCHIICCFRAKEKLKIVKGQEPIDLGWQPIAGEQIAFETIFTLMLPPRSNGVPDMALSDMRRPFTELIPAGEPLSEETGARLAAWAAGGASGGASVPPAAEAAAALGEPETDSPETARPDASAGDPEAGVAAGSSGSPNAELWEQADALTATLRDMHPGNQDVARYIERNRVEHADDPAAHVAWLTTQVENAQARQAVA
jgi:hypothetical protein